LSFASQKVFNTIIFFVELVLLALIVCDFDYVGIF